MKFSNITEETVQVMACVPDDVVVSIDELLTELKTRYEGDWTFQATHKIYDRFVHHRFRRSIPALHAV